MRAKRYLLAGVALTALGIGAAQGADMAIVKAPPVALFTWTGGYVGVTAGEAWGSYDTNTTTGGLAYLNAARQAAVNAAGPQRVKATGFATGVEAGYNWQTGRFLFGVEADAQSVHLNAYRSSGGITYPGSALFFVQQAYANTDWMITARARAGFVADNNWLFYATGGLAVAKTDTDRLFNDSNGALEAGRFDGWRAGYVVGGGIEAPITKQLSLKAEYLYAHFGTTNVPVTANNLAAAFPAQVFTHSTDLSVNIARVGLNYRFVGGDPWSSPAVVMPVKAPILKAPAAPIASDWEFEAGARLWFSTGVNAPDQPLLGLPPEPSVVLSRLTYSNLNAISGETFARVDQKSGLFVKGFLGAGGIRGGQLNDEDFPGFAVYSNTLSNVSGHIGYANIDVGYSFLTAPGARVGAFVGYNHYSIHNSAYGCTQLAADLVCAPGQIQNGYLGITEHDTYQSLRLGVSAQFMLTERLRLTADAAYIPAVKFTGEDNHNARQLVFPEWGNRGDGTMLEAILEYRVADGWNVGIGGRYWAWNMRTGTTGTIDLTPGAGPQPDQLQRFATERYGAFVQTSYRWGDTTASAVPAMPTKAAYRAPPMNWTGFYVGAHLGGGWSRDRWSDPFPSAGGNIAGFGDFTRANGPLGGGQIGADIQFGSWVLGVQADYAWADLHGENTCFSGLGGVNCQRVVNNLGTATLRAAYAWDRALAYVKGGAAWVGTTYDINANTGVLVLGYGSTKVTRGGWTVGGGIEYALTDHWTTSVEFDHVDIASSTVPFPTVAVINAQSIAVKQWIDTLKVGVNYRFGADSVVAKY